jgi:hypothetical protein
MTFKEALGLMGRDEAFKATVYAMNTLLIQKGVYTSEEFEQLFCEHALNFKKAFSGKSGRETVLETASEASRASR